MMYGQNEGDEVIILRQVKGNDAFSTRTRELIHGVITMKVADEVNEWGYVVKCNRIEKYSMYAGHYNVEDFNEKSELFQTYVDPTTVLSFGFFSEDDWNFSVTCLKRMSTATLDIYNAKELVDTTLRRSRGK